MLCTSYFSIYNGTYNNGCCCMYLQSEFRILALLRSIFVVCQDTARKALSPLLYTPSILSFTTAYDPTQVANSIWIQIGCNISSTLPTDHECMMYDSHNHNPPLIIHMRVHVTLYIIFICRCLYNHPITTINVIDWRNHKSLTNGISKLIMIILLEDAWLYDVRYEVVAAAFQYPQQLP